MSFDLDGYVLRAPRSAPGNATSTANADTGVLRDVRDLPGTYDLPGDLVEARGDMYRAAVLSNPDGGSQEYLVWAANSSSLALVEDTTWAVTDEGTVSIPTGTLTVTDLSPSDDQTDGTANLVVTDDAGRSLSSVRSISIVRGDDTSVPPTAITVGPDGTHPFDSQDADAGLVTIGSAGLTALGGGVSATRGDYILSMTYVVAAQRFWWTRNDTNTTRFGWNGKFQRWEAFKGTPPVDLGILNSDDSYTLAPRPDRFEAGDSLPGDSGTPAAYAMVRLGERPDETSTPVDVVVVTDDQAEGTYTFTTEDAVVGVTSGVLQWNPTYIASNAGKRIWYVYESFQDEETGALGDLKDAGDEPLFMCPIPGPTDRPFIKLGFRRYLTPVAYDNETDLGAASISEGFVGWARTTGRLKFSDDDITKAEPGPADTPNPDFVTEFLGTVVYYDGVSMCTTSLPLPDPVQLVNSSGTPIVVDASTDLFLPAAEALPNFGTSGAFLVPDGTGTLPASSPTPQTRPNGSGLVRQIEGVGDLILFGPSGAFEEVRVVEFEDDQPDFPFRIRKGRAWVASQALTAAGLSKFAIGVRDRTRFAGEPLYFLQAAVTPAIYAEEARIYSRVAEPYTLEGTEVLAFAIDGAPYTWSASTTLGAGEFTAAQIAADIDTVITGTGQATASNGRVVLEAGTITTGSIEIGFGSTSSGAFADRDLSGCAVLGFLPGWRVDDPSTNDNWLPDSGTSLGVFRSPQNKDRKRDKPDFRNRARFNNVVISKGVSAGPYQAIDQPPLVDVAGYDDGVFFNLVDGLFTRILRNYEDVLFDFANDRIGWLDSDVVTSRVELQTNAVGLGHPMVVPDTLHPSVNSGGFYVAETGGAFSVLTDGEHFLLPQDGQPGIAHLIEEVGARVAFGSNGSFASNSTTFTDPNATFVTDGVLEGYRLKITGGDAKGSYLVSVDAVSETSLTLDSAVPFASAGSEVTWEVYEGLPDSVYDPALVADVVYESFNHLPTEPFEILLLDGLGLVPANEAAQTTTRLQAVISEALERGREISIRFGQPDGSPTATLAGLEQTELGPLANGTLTVPDTSDLHFTTGAFTIKVGSTSYTPVAVSVFSTPIPAGTVEYGDVGSGIEGELGFADDILADLEESTVYYVETFLDPDDMTAGQAEYDPATGDLNFSAPDMASYGTTTTAYFVEKMITEEQLDVVISPLSGSFHINRPLREGQLVEATYLQAATDGTKKLDDDGNEISTTEFLPRFIRDEEATRIDATHYSINPDGNTIATAVDPLIWADHTLHTYGNEPTGVMVPEDDEVQFTVEIESTATVIVSYAVYEAAGGEQDYSVSNVPVYRPPFYIEEAQSTFALETDRTADMTPGKLLRVGPHLFYIEAASYDAGDDETTVTFFPPTEGEAGSRAPGNDVLSLLSSVPVTDDVNGTSTAGATGFLLTVTAAYEPVDRGMQAIVVQGDVTQFAVAGHLLELGGYPYLVTDSTLSDDGRYTSITISTPFHKGFKFGTDTLKLSARPIYPPQAREFLGVYPYLPSEGIELVLFGETDGVLTLPGRTLTEDIEYVADPGSGAIILVRPVQAALLAGQKLLFRYTRLKSIGPFLSDGQVVVPRFSARYQYVTIPDDENGFLGAVLQGRYSFRNPDSFYYRAVPLDDYMGEVAEQAAASVAAKQPHGGPVTAASGGTENYEQGAISLPSERRELEDRDRAARTFISFYNQTIVAFEQVSEAINGEVIGDRHGKFRFFVGRHKTYAPPGYEDQITGYMNPRNIWSEVFEATQGSFGVTEDDDIVDPETATQDPTSLEVTGDMLDPFLFGFYLDQQRELIHNDIDDIVLVRRKRPRLAFGLPFPTVRLSGDFRIMGEAHAFSRLFPEEALVFTTTFPGLEANLAGGDPGVYTFLRMLDPPQVFKGEGPVFGSTFRKPIGTISNPVLGTVANVTDIQTRDRLARARIWAYSETGFPEMDTLLAAAGETTFASSPRPAVIATPLYLKDFPIDIDTGFPDVAQLISEGGTLPDLDSGDQELSTPAFLPYDSSTGERQQLSFGRPTGETFGVGVGGAVISSLPFSDFTAPSSYKGVFIGEVMLGCIITFSDGNDIISDAADIVALGTGELGTEPFDLAQGDTVYVIPPGGLDPNDLDGASMSDPPTAKEMEELAAQLPDYRRGFDYGVKKRKGFWVDNSLPSFADPFPFGFKELLGQKPISPMTPIEADIGFVNNDKKPLEFPALKGEATNDYGDFAIPYLGTQNTELDRLAQVAQTIQKVLEADEASAPGSGWSVYPDEVIGTDGTIYDAASGTDAPAVLHTAQDFTPVATAGSYTANSGIGDVERYDLVLFEVSGDTQMPVGAQGILSVGEVTTNTIEAPRFVSRTVKGDRLRYTLNGAMAHIAGGGVNGMEVFVSGGDTFFRISSISSMEFATAASTAGLNNILNIDPSGGAAAFSENRVVIRLFDPSDGTLLETVTLSGDQTAGPDATATGGAGTGTSLVAHVVDPTVIQVDSTGFVDFSASGLNKAPADTGIYFDFVIDIDTATAGPSGSTYTGSLTAFVDDDRLTFSEDVDFGTAQERGTTTISTGLVNVQAELDVVTVDDGGSAEDLTINDASECNGGDDFTFLPRTSGGSIGSYNSGTGTSTLKVHGFEGHNNTVLVGAGGDTPIIFSAMPSADEDEDGVICNGDGDASNSVLQDLTGLTGSVDSIDSGDILVVKLSAAGGATSKAGTYIIRAGIGEVGATPGAREITTNAVAPTSAKFLSLQFNTISSFSQGGLSVTVGALQDVPDSPTTHAWASSGRLYVLPSDTDLTQVVSMAYSSVVGGTGVFTVTTGTATDADGTAITDTEFFDALTAGDKVSGMVYLPIGKFPAPLMEGNAVGYDHGGTTEGGFLHLTITNEVVATAVSASATSVTWTVGGGNPIVGGAPAAGEIGVNTETTPVASTSFLSDETTRVYPDVATYLDMSAMLSADWETIHDPSSLGTIAEVACVVVGDKFVTNDAADGTGTAGFQAKAGIFLEPSMPKPTIDLGGSDPLVVHQSGSTLAASQIGMRDVGVYSATLTDPETVTFEVRRIRRFHEVLDGIGDNLGPLRFAYEIRRGDISSYTSSTRVLVADTATYGTATQLGDFDDIDVNINPGDTVRLIDGDTGQLLDTAEVSVIQSGTDIKLSAPGFTVSLPANPDFEVYLRVAPVPHEQSNEQLLSLITDEVVFEQTAVPNTAGGRATTINELRDSDGTVDYTTLGVAEGDIVIVDPAGELSGPGGQTSPVEKGARPFGDDSVLARMGGTPDPYTAGGPSDLDDNRGHWRVSTVNADNLVLNPAHEFAGAGTDLTFGSTGEEYAVLPTVNGSVAPFAVAGRENQNDLRETAVADGGDSYSSDNYSVEPFSYRIIRPSGLFSDEAVDLVLFMRERMLSWIEEIQTPSTGVKQGSYYVFQRDDHITNLGSPTVPDDGLGVMFNASLTSLQGLTGMSPFANVSDCLSVLDRRYWCLDFRLDALIPPFGPGVVPYSDFANGDGRPVLPDLITDVLDQNDRFRALRYTWINYRTNVISGTLPTIDRFDETLQDRLDEQEDLLRIQESMEGT